MNVVAVAVALDPDDTTRLLDEFSDTPLAIRIPGIVAQHVPEARARAMAAAGWTALIGGWSSPILASLPEASRRMQLEREVEWWRRTGNDRLAGWVEEGWEPSLILSFTTAGLDQVFVAWPPPAPATPVVTDYAGDAVTVFPLGGRLCPVVGTGALEGTPVWPGGLPSPPLARLDPPIDRSWVGRLAGDPEANLLYRKMLRLARTLPERIPPEVVDWLGEAQSASLYGPGADRTAAHAALAASRRRLDLGRRRSSDWTRISTLDWDADGADEVQIETGLLSMVVDPDDGMVTYVDHKPAGRAVTYVPGQAPWHLAQVLDGHDARRVPLALTGVEEARGRAAVTCSGRGLETVVATAGSVISLDYRVGDDLGHERVGPEMPFAFEAPVRLRVDGAEWEAVAGPRAVTGHRFRFDDGVHQIVVGLEQPGDLFVRPVDGGLVVWGNWPLTAGRSGTVEYRMTVEIVG